MTTDTALVLIIVCNVVMIVCNVAALVFSVSTYRRWMAR